MSPREASGLIGLVGSTDLFFDLGVTVGPRDGLPLLMLVWRRWRETPSGSWLPGTSSGALSPGVRGLNQARLFGACR